MTATCAYGSVARGGGKAKNGAAFVRVVATNIPADHPRARSLRTRERLAKGVEDGLVHRTGLIAHGRGEAFDYLLGEQTTPPAEAAIKVAARALVAAKHPVVCVNGNVVALAAKDAARLAEAAHARVEVNIFHRTPERLERLIDAMQRAGASGVLGAKPDARIEGLVSDRALCTREGIGQADLVLVPLEDGDRCEALVAAGKVVLTIELNPLTRTAAKAHVTIVDELTRALPLLTEAVRRLREAGDPPQELGRVVESWDNQENLRAAREQMVKRLRS